MAVSFIDFVPSTVKAPQYEVTLDGNLYTLIVEWLLYAQRYFIRLVDLDGRLIIYAAMVGSPIGINIEALSWANGTVTVTTAEPHFLQIGQVINLTVTGCVPETFNGFVQASVTGPNTLTYSLASNPGQASTFGSLQQNIDLCQGMFNSILVFREANNQFEVIS